MYERHFGFKSKPFALTPDPAFLYLSTQHAMAMTMLEYGLESQAAFSLLTGANVSPGRTLAQTAAVTMQSSAISKAGCP